MTRLPEGSSGHSHAGQRSLKAHPWAGLAGGGPHAWKPFCKARLSLAFKCPCYPVPSAPARPSAGELSEDSSSKPCNLLPDGDPEQPLHDCAETLSSMKNLREDLTDQPLRDPEETLYTDGSSFVDGGTRYAGAAVVTADKVVWAQALGHGTSAQKAELIALTQALRWAKGRTVHIYTDSPYAFATVHVHGALYQERGLLTSGGKEIKNVPEILALLAALWLPKAVAVIHCKGHQSADTPEARGNAFTEKTAKEAAPKPVGPLHILPALPTKVFEETPIYSETDNELGKRLHIKEVSRGWRELPDTRLFIPEALGRELISQVHQSTHLGGTKLVELLKRDYYIPKLFQVSKDIARRGHVCAQAPLPPPPLAQGTRLRGRSPGEHWEVDFTELPPGRGGYRYLLVFIDTFSGWPEAYPTKSEAAQIVVKKLVSEIIPRFGLPVAMGSDNGLAFIAHITQLLAKILGIS
ncbi:hypothetical protein QTO34_006880 [Cnephaeus nilssonii]|uniref:Uncharacterized protein n=1 Tax=Cnephaeus nilssonii TaxID=3371016 RepID=A0AA40HJ69_CNENI|nr:hypothetical protein QTO34_006880 [Eptesicus nilssonii]